MNEVASTLWLAAGTSAVAALALALAAPTPRPRGFALWQAAAALPTAAIALAAGFGHRSGALLPAQLLLLPWPVLALSGMRRFHARIDWPGSASLDLALLAVCALLVAVGGVWRDDSPSLAVGVPGGALLVHLYAASLLVCAGASPALRPAHLLGAVIALAACAPMVAALAGLEHEGIFVASAAATSLAVAALAFVACTLVHERREHHLQGAQRQWQALARTDARTRLPGPRTFEHLAARVLASDPSASSVLVAFDFDPVPAGQTGDTGGGAARALDAERALRLVARGLRRVLRLHDLACHHGREGFTLLLRRTRAQQAMRVAERLAEAILHEAAPTPEPASHPRPTLSFGLVQVGPGEDVERARQRALQALAQARRHGRARIVAAAGSEHAPQVIESRALDLRHA